MTFAPGTKRGVLISMYYGMIRTMMRNNLYYEKILILIFSILSQISDVIDIIIRFFNDILFVLYKPNENKKNIYITIAISSKIYQFLAVQVSLPYVTKFGYF